MYELMTKKNSTIIKANKDKERKFIYKHTIDVANYSYNGQTNFYTH